MKISASWPREASQFLVLLLHSRGKRFVQHGFEEAAAFGADSGELRFELVA